MRNKVFCSFAYAAIFQLANTHVDIHFPRMLTTTVNTNGNAHSPILQWQKKYCQQYSKSYIVYNTYPLASLLHCKSLLLLKLNWTLLRRPTHSCICQNKWSFICVWDLRPRFFFAFPSFIPQFMFIVFVIQLLWDMWKKTWIWQ